MFRYSIHKLFDLKGKNAIVTGGSKGIGYQIAVDLANKGANVCIWSRDKQTNEKAVKSLPTIHNGQNHHGIICDLSTDINNDKLDSTIKQIKSNFNENGGRISILIHSAGITHNQLLLKKDNNDIINEIIKTNLISPMYITQSLIKDMMRLKDGRIIFIGSVVASMGNKGQTIYSASKSGLHGFSKSLSKEIGQFNCTTNIISPGFIETEMTTDFINDTLINSIPLKRIGNVKDISKTALFLIENDYITGQNIQVDGGLY